MRKESVYLFVIARSLALCLSAHIFADVYALLVCIFIYLFFLRFSSVHGWHGRRVRQASTSTDRSMWFGEHWKAQLIQWPSFLRHCLLNSPIRFEFSVYLKKPKIKLAADEMRIQIPCIVHANWFTFDCKSTPYGKHVAHWTALYILIWCFSHLHLLLLLYIIKRLNSNTHSSWFSAQIRNITGIFEIAFLGHIRASLFDRTTII